MSFQLDPTQHTGGEIVRVAREQIGNAVKSVSNRRKTLSERVHLARTRCKKTRAALRLLRNLDRERFREENRALASAARKLSQLRDADAMLACLAALLKHATTGMQRRKFAPVTRALHADRKRATAKKADAETALRRFAARLGQSNARLTNWAPSDDAESMIADHRRTYRRARAGLEAAKELGTATAFHEWRKATKTYYYQCRLLRAAWPPAMKEVRVEVKALARVLGDEHDLTVLRNELRRLRRKARLNVQGDVFTATIVLVEDRREELRREALSLGERIFAERPRALAARIAKWWRIACDQPAAA
jgi:CHAD domain-containing protein